MWFLHALQLATTSAAAACAGSHSGKRNAESGVFSVQASVRGCLQHDGERTLEEQLKLTRERIEDERLRQGTILHRAAACA